MPVQRSTKVPPYTVTIDGEPVRLQLSRMTVAEFEAFNAEFVAYGRRPDFAPAGASLPREVEAAKQRLLAMAALPPTDTDGPAWQAEVPVLVTALEQLATQLAAAQGDATAAAWLETVKQEAALRAANADWLVDVFRRYVTVVEGDFVVDGVAVTDGAAFVAAMTGDQDTLQDILAQLWMQNRLSEAQKKIFASRGTSGTGSGAAPNPATSGETPATAASAVAPEGSAAAAAAMGSSSDTSSGTTVEPSSSEPVPSAV